MFTKEELWAIAYISDMHLIELRKKKDEMISTVGEDTYLRAVEYIKTLKNKANKLFIEDKTIDNNKIN